MTSCRNNQSVYIPHILRSHPFRFIFFPIGVVLLFIFLWFAVYPLIHVYVYKQSIDASENWFWFYWPVALLLFLILLMLLLCIWRCKLNNSTFENSEEKECILLNNRRKDKDFYTVSLTASEASTVSNENKNQNIELAEITPAKTERLFPRCSVKRKPDKLQLERVVIHEQAKTACLSPRELFFKDLLQGDNKSNSSVVFNQPLEEAVLSAINKTALNEKKNISREYFIASVSPKLKEYKNNIFMYVNAEEENIKLTK